jgi:hypothetical protein
VNEFIVPCLQIGRVSVSGNSKQVSGRIPVLDVKNGRIGRPDVWPAGYLVHL